MSRSWAKGSSKGWRRLRQQVIQRDGGVCQYCGSDENLHIDHIIPKRLNGSDDMDNLITACRRCNLAKGGSFFGTSHTPPTLHGRNLPENVSVSHE